jgi:hypothetical protein
MPSMMLAVIVVQLTTMGCSGDGGIDCLGDPDLYKVVSFGAESLPPGQVGVAYEGLLQAEVENEPDDDAYDYEFDLRDGAFPPGIVTDQDDGRLFLTGVPTEAGTFTFEIEVDVEPDGFSDPCLLLTPRTEEFTIVVEPE